MIPITLADIRAQLAHISEQWRSGTSTEKQADLGLTGGNSYRPPAGTSGCGAPSSREDVAGRFRFEEQPLVGTDPSSAFHKRRVVRRWGMP